MKVKLNDIFTGAWSFLTDEQKAKAKACKTVEELSVFAKQAGVELPDELMEAVSGGVQWQSVELEYIGDAPNNG